jgi:hypothetical protein
MTTATLTKKTVETTWNTSKIQEEAARLAAVYSLTAHAVLAKFGEQALEQYSTLMRERKIEHYKQMGVKTPLELVNVMSEMEANLFGSKLEIWGDEKSATMKYDSCAMWNAMQKVGKLNAQQEEQIGSQWENCMRATANEFGFNLETKFEGECCTMTFTTK